EFYTPRVVWWFVWIAADTIIIGFAADTNRIGFCGTNRIGYRRTRIDKRTGGQHGGFGILYGQISIVV
ncbi:unnamed protein product, partial [Laminaria digitata]